MCAITLDSVLSVGFWSLDFSSSLSFPLPVSISVGCSTFFSAVSAFTFGLISLGCSGFLSPAGIEILGLDITVSKPA